MTVTIVFALLTAFCNATVVAVQHLASIRASPQLKGVALARYLLKSPLWLLGWVGILGAFVFQAVALHNGQLSVVQPLLVSELVFALRNRLGGGIQSTDEPSDISCWLATTLNERR